ncbi:MAG: glycosyltransferase family 39 protein [Planctomycetota bacterium]|nr:glycosyltransferase family 39 protein [Planctomycetota bacterium]
MLLAVVFAALAVRLTAVAIWSEQLEVDTDGYRSLAQGIAASGEYINAQTREPTAFRPPFYPLVLSVFFFLNVPSWGIGVFQSLLGALTVALTGQLARRLGLSNRRACVAAAIVAFDPILIGFTVQAMTETLFTLLLTALVVSWINIHSGASAALDSDAKLRSTASRQCMTGFLLGVCGLCRPTVWAFAMLVAGAGIWRHRRCMASAFNWRLALGAFVVVVPWATRNSLLLGRPIVTTTHGGYTLLLGNNPVFYDEVLEAPWGTTWSHASLVAWQGSLEVELHQAGIAGELARDAWMQHRALSNIRADPGSFIRACALRIVRFWRVAPHECSGLVRTATGLFYTVVLLAFASRLIRAARQGVPLSPPVQIVLLAILSFSAVHAVYWSNMRMRGPLIPLIAVVIAGALCRNFLPSCSQNPESQT